MKFCTADFTEEEFQQNRQKAYEKLKSGEPYGFSNGICESVTAGYGRLDYYGYWEYPLIVDQVTLQIIPLECNF